MQFCMFNLWDDPRAVADLRAYHSEQLGTIKLARAEFATAPMFNQAEEAIGVVPAVRTIKLFVEFELQVAQMAERFPQINAKGAYNGTDYAHIGQLAMAIIQARLTARSAAYFQLLSLKNASI